MTTIHLIDRTIARARGTKAASFAPEKIIAARIETGPTGTLVYVTPEGPPVFYSHDWKLVIT